jgi:hypothetical protein
MPGAPESMKCEVAIPLEERGENSFQHIVKVIPNAARAILRNLG